MIVQWNLVMKRSDMYTAIVMYVTSAGVTGISLATPDDGPLIDSK